MSTGHSVARRGISASGHSRLRLERIDFYIQSHPGTAGNPGVQGLNYEVRVGRSAPRTGTTGADGKITLRLGAGQVAQVTVLGTTYNVSIASSVEANTTTRGVQFRLNSLGYELGTVDGTIGSKTDRALLTFQADNAPLPTDGQISSNFRTQLTTQAGF